MHQPTPTIRTHVTVATWSLIAVIALALTLVACGSEPTNGEPPPTGDISIAVTVVGDGRATLGALEFTCTDTCTLVVDEGTEVALAAVPDAGRVLVAWEGPCSPFGDTCAWQADEDVAVTVTFAPHALRFDLEGDGEGYFEINAAGNVTECREACGVAVQQPQPLQVTIIYFSDGATRTTLDPWIGTCQDETNTYCLVLVDGVTTIGKTWRHPPIAEDHEYQMDQGDPPLTIGAPGVLQDVDDTPGDTHTVTVVDEPQHGDLTLASDGSFTYEPASNFGGVDTFTYRVTDAFGNESVDVGTAHVTVRPRLIVNTQGSGRVVSEPAGIDCGVDCTSMRANFDLGTEITLTATPTIGTTFTNWTGGPCTGVTSLICTFTIASSGTTTANFGVAAYTLDVTRSGNGTGTITSTPPGIDVTTTQPNDDATFNHGQEITLTANPATSSTFTSWTSGPCNGSTNTTCTFTITNDTTITATFELAEFDLDVTTSGLGNGNVTSDPAGIDLDGGDVSAAFMHGTTIRLMATAAAVSEFGGWSGADCAEGASDDECTFVIEQDMEVDAAFDLAL